MSLPVLASRSTSLASAGPSLNSWGGQAEEVARASSKVCAHAARWAGANQGIHHSHTFKEGTVPQWPVIPALSMTQNSPHRSQISVERATGLHTQCRKSFKPWSHQGQLMHGACLYKVGILYCSDRPSSRVRGVAPGQGAQKREREC